MCPNDAARGPDAPEPVGDRAERSMNRQALVSIGLPVYNGARFLSQALESLLGQSYRNIELIISDNASTDATREICQSYASLDRRVRHSRLTENIGGVPNHNRVFEAAKGEYFMWSSHDDLWAPTYVEKCVAALEEDRGAVLAYSKARVIDERGETKRVLEVQHTANSPRPADRFREFTALSSILEASYGVMRLSVARRTAGLPPHPGNDRLFLAELALYGRFVQVLEHLYMRRDHDDRSVKVYSTLRERYAWIAPREARKRRFPYWGYLAGYTSAASRVPLSLRDRAACARVLLALVKHNWRELLGDLIR